MDELDDEGTKRRIDMPSATVKWFNATKAYGFFQPDGGDGKDGFVHSRLSRRPGLANCARAPRPRSNRGKESAENLR